MPTVKIKTYYICQGSVRGSCGVRHRTESTAEACCAADHRGCQSQGGYSDRRPVKRTVSMLRGV